MKNRTRIWYAYISNKKFRKNFILPIVICSILLITIFSLYKTINAYLIDGVMKTPDYQNYFITYPFINKKDDVINKLKSIKHVKNVYETYEDHYSVFLNEINDIKIEGSFILVGDDEKFENKEKNSIICPEHFYPSDNLEDNHFVKKSEILNIENLINKDFLISYYKYIDDFNSEENKISLKLIDTYNNNPNIIDENICYAPRELVSTIFEDAYENIDLSNQIDSIIINIDDSDNYDYVKKEVEKIGYDISPAFTLNENFFSFVHSLCIFISVISIIFSVVVTINMNKRRLLDKMKEFGILKSLGYSKKELKKILLYENIILFVMCVFIIFVLLICFNIILSILLNVYPFILNKVPISIDYTAYFIFIFIVFICLTITNMHYQKIICNCDISKSLGE